MWPANPNECIIKTVRAHPENFEPGRQYTCIASCKPTGANAPEACARVITPITTDEGLHCEGSSGSPGCAEALGTLIRTTEINTDFL